MLESRVDEVISALGGGDAFVAVRPAIRNDGVERTASVDITQSNAYAPREDGFLVMLRGGSDLGGVSRVSHRGCDTGCWSGRLRAARGEVACPSGRRHGGSHGVDATVWYANFLVAGYVGVLVGSIGDVLFETRAVARSDEDAAGMVVNVDGGAVGGVGKEG